MNFPGGSICSSNRYEFSRRAYRKDMFFQGGSICSSNRPYYLIEQILISQKPLFSPRTHTKFPGASIFSSNRYSFSRKPYLVLEHLRFSRRLYLVLEHIQFPRSPLCLEHRHFPGRYTLSNRHFANRSRWLLSYFFLFYNFKGQSLNKNTLIPILLA